MEQISGAAILGLISVAVIGGIGIAAKETIGNFWVSICFILSRTVRKGKVLEANVQGELIRGKIKGFGLSRMTVEDPEGNIRLILNSDLKKTTIKIIEPKSKENRN